MAHPNDPTDENAPPDEPRPVAALSAEQMQVYGDAIAAQREREAATASAAKTAERATAELRQERLMLHAVARERARIWVHICRDLGIDPEGVYTLDDARQVFAETPTKASADDVDHAR